VNGLLRDPGVEEPLQRLERVEVRLAEDLLVGVRARESQRLALSRDELDRQIDLLRQLARRVLRLAPERQLDRQEREAALLDRLLQVLERDAIAVQLLQQLEPRPPLVVLEPLEQPLGLEVGLRDPTRLPAAARASARRACRRAPSSP
jgi:hypothetical protein